MNEDFVTFELAKKLKEKGFPQRTFGEYDMQGACYIEDGRFYENGCITEVARAYTSPTISQVLRWLREKHLLVLPDPAYFDSEGVCISWDCNIWVGDTFEECLINKTTYEQAALAGIEYTLDNAI